MPSILVTTLPPLSCRRHSAILESEETLGARLGKRLGHSRLQSPSFLGHVVGKQIKPSGSGDENEVGQVAYLVHMRRRPFCQ